MSQPSLHVAEQQYERFRALILRRSGLHFTENRRRDLERGLQQALEQSGYSSLDDYYDHLAHNHTRAREWEQLICHLTIGETYFFRDRSQFQALRQHVLPEIISLKRASSRQLRIWSAGCATGEEPYSVAILLRELLPDLSEWQITILATDINREALARAEAGLYGPWSFREQGWEPVRDTYFTRQGKLWQLDRRVRDMVSFAYLNLAEDPYPALMNNTVAFDLILCRNVTIYFTLDTTQRVVDQFYEALIERGWLVVGHSEPSLVVYARYEPHNYPGAVLYQKLDGVTSLDLSWLEEWDLSRPADRADVDLTMPFFPASTGPAGQHTDPVQSERYAQARDLLEQEEGRVGATTDTVRQGVPALSEQAGQPAVADTTPEGAPPQGATPDRALTSAELCTEAEELVAQKRVEEALERLQCAMKCDPNCARAGYLVAKLRADGGHWEDARYWCEWALERDPLLVQAHFLSGLLHSQEGNVELALGAMKRVVFLDRDAVLGHYWLANLYEELGKPERARKSLETAAQLLAVLPPQAEIPWSEGMTAGRLRYIVQRQRNGG